MNKACCILLSLAALCFGVASCDRNDPVEDEKVKLTCSICNGDGECPTCHGTGKGCETCGGSGVWCSRCGGSGNCDVCHGDRSCFICYGSGYRDCYNCNGSKSCGICHGAGKNYYYGSWVTCTYCSGTGKCPTCNGSGIIKCSTCYGSGKCSLCYGTGKCDKCNGNPVCSTCGGDGHCSACPDGNGKCSACDGLGYIWVDPNAPPEDNTPEDNTPDDIPEGQGQEDEIFFCPDGNHPHAIDMGSGVLWSCCNIGAAKPTDYGDYYAWGETEPQYVTLDPLKWKYGKSGYDWITYKWCGGTMYTMTKYNYNSSFGSIDNKRELEREDDAAWVNSGHKWRMPTQEEFNRMIQNSNWKAVEIAGVAGLQFVSNINGNVLFFPAAGDWQSDDQWGTNYYDREYAGAYWTSTLEDEDFTKSAYLLLYFMDLLDPGFVGAGYSLDRCFGCSVRGIKAQ